MCCWFDSSGEKEMPIEVGPGGISITGEDGIATYRLVLLHNALKLQARTGMKASRVSAVACAQRLGYVGRTAKTLLRDIEKKHPELIRD